ncbi:beta-galactosidase [Candidatus Sumerlaeota bacterium]|nr:beta-galactosidase [Candidatus Sumerlaeota bacterium]
MNLMPPPKPYGQPQPKFEIGKQQFLMDGKPVVLISGSIHYPRVPRPYWRDRMKKARAMGLNCIDTYVFWNAHEKRPGEFDFSGNLDLEEFLRIAQEEGLWVILRPGPYICAEWNFGGYPPWLMKDQNVELRSDDPAFLEATARYFSEVGKRVGHMQITHGGPILMVQVENEYGVFAKEPQPNYTNAIRQQYIDAGFDAQFMRCDWANESADRIGHIEGAIYVLNFGSNPQKAFEYLTSKYPDAPRMCGEYWIGWFDSWGDPHHESSVKDKIAESEWMLSQGISINIYMFHGGTNFGFNSGCDWNWRNEFKIDTTSYDYSAILNERGEPTAKFEAFQQLIQSQLPEGAQLPPLPEPIPTITVPAFEMTECAPLTQLMTRSQTADTPLHMEALECYHGYMLYRTTIKEPSAGNLAFATVKDRAIIRLNGKVEGVLDRRYGDTSMRLEVTEKNSTLEVLVENVGYLNYSYCIRDEYKGIPGEVKFCGETLNGWEMFPLPLPVEDIAKLKFEAKKDGDASDEPMFYRATFDIEQTGDTYLDMRGWSKGHVWVNGYHLGRYWDVGPQMTLFMPGCWLKQGANEIIVFDLEPVEHPSVQGLEAPVWETKADDDIKLHREPGQELILSSNDIIATGTFSFDVDEQLVQLDSARQARYICLESLSSQKDDNFASLADLRLLDADGQSIDRGEWTVVYADSEEVIGESAGANYIIDDNPRSIWHTRWQGEQPSHPHQIVIDLGNTTEFKTVVCVHRPGDNPGKIKEYRIYARIEPFEITGP